MTAIAWWISFSNLDTFLVKLANPRQNFRCSFTANAVPLLLVGGGMPDSLDCDRVPMAGGALCSKEEIRIRMTATVSRRR